MRNKINDVFQHWVTVLKKQIIGEEMAMLSKKGGNTSKGYQNNADSTSFQSKLTAMDENIRMLTWEDKLSILLRPDAHDERI